MAKKNPTDPPKKPMTKAALVRSLPVEMPAAEVVKKAAEAGITITPAHVHTLRSNAKRAGNKGSKTKTSKPATRKPKAITKASKQKTGATSQFILAQPSTLTATEVVEKGNKAGFSFKANYVYKVRMNTNKRTRPVAASKRAKGTKQRAARKPQAATARKRKTTRKATKAYVATGKPAAGLMTPEMVFVRLALDIGVQRAKDLLTAVDEKIAKLITSVR